jgi:DNA-binding transcriptional MerR regulator
VATKGNRAEKLYGTKQVAEFLDIPIWRVKNFSEGRAYGLPPLQTVGTGRGSRRLYNEVDIYRMAIANALVDLGFSPEVVGHAHSKIPESVLADVEGDSPDDIPILVCKGGLWRVQRAGDVASLVDNTLIYPGEEFGIVILNISNVLEGVFQRTEKASGRRANRNPSEGGKH